MPPLIATVISTLEGELVTLSFGDSIKKLKDADVVEQDQDPKVPERMPQYDDDDPSGLSFFRTAVEGEVFDDLALPRTFFGRSEIARCSFKGTNLAESNFCWNDLIEVDFSGANLSNCDLRASQYEEVSFAGADLSGADLRMSGFERCSFEGASLRGAKLTRQAAATLGLSSEQAAAVDWQTTDGEEPGGG